MSWPIIDSQYNHTEYMLKSFKCPFHSLPSQYLIYKCNQLSSAYCNPLDVGNYSLTITTSFLIVILQCWVQWHSPCCP